MGSRFSPGSSFISKCGRPPGEWSRANRSCELRNEARKRAGLVPEVTVASDSAPPVETSGKMTPLLHIRADRRFPEHPLKSLWEARELMVLLARRDVRLRYQHSVAGFGWALLQPLLTIL